MMRFKTINRHNATELKIMLIKNWKFLYKFKIYTRKSRQVGGWAKNIYTRLGSSRRHNTAWRTCSSIQSRDYKSHGWELSFLSRQILILMVQLELDTHYTRNNAPIERDRVDYKAVNDDDGIFD